MESELSGLMSMDGAMMPTDDDDDENGDENGFTQGGAATFPFLKNIFQGPNGEETTKEQEETDASSRKTDDKKKKKRKYLNMYCTCLLYTSSCNFDCHKRQQGINQSSRGRPEIGTAYCAGINLSLIHI